MRPWLHPVLTALAMLIALVVLLEWRSERQDRARLQTELAQAEQSLQKATASQVERDKHLTGSLSKLDDLKRTVKTQQQILTSLPEVLPLPKPIQATTSPTDPRPATDPGTETHALPNAPSPSRTAEIPPEDLKPLYDFVVDCKACQSRLAAATADLADEKIKTKTLGRERDAALKLARGGSLRQRVGRALKWFAIGALAGAVAAKH